MEQKLQAFARLLKIMDELREQCPWDKKQTIQSLRHLTIEETYELADAIISNDLQNVKKELGDLMLHLVFYARIASETNQFDIGDVLNSVCDKLIERHPHIYGDVKVKDEEEVKSNWEKLKLKAGNLSVLEGVPVSLPAMVKSIRIQEKARGVGFDWDNSEQVWDKVKEELEELKHEVDNKTDTQQFMLPISVPLIFAYIISAMGIDNSEGTAQVWCSFIPFTSPVSMMSRVVSGTVPGWHVAISMFLLVVTFIFTTWMAGKIYRTGILMYGKKASYRELWKWLRYKG